ncbi:MAG: hypothetical protein HY328_11090 [Chloroflexi bacterium]|nr:hypothetical protein [Chloroflexota bacterium]
MPTLETLSRNDVTDLFTKSAFSKARDYQTRVGSPVRTGSRLTAKVLGTKMYDVEVEVGEQGIHATCTCGYEWDGHCKHIGAVLLRWLEKPEAFQTNQAEPAQAVAGLEVVPAKSPPPTPPAGLPAWLTTPFADRQKREREILEASLDRQTLVELRQVAAARGWRLSGTRKAEIVAQIAEGIASVGETAKAIYSLETEYQQVLRSLALHSGSRVSLGSTMEQTALAQGPLQKYDTVSAYTYRLVESGLIFPPSIGAINLSQPAGLVGDFVPFALARNFPPLLETIVPSAWQLESAETGHTVHLADPQMAVRAVQNLLLLFEQEPPRLRPPQPRPRLEKFHTGLQGWAYVPEEVARVLARSPQDLRQQAVVLTVPPPGYALADEAIEKFLPLCQNSAHLDFLYALLAAAGLIQRGSPVQVWPAGRDPFLMRDPAMQHAALARTYFQMNGWIELWEAQRRNPHLCIKRRTNAYYQTPETILGELIEYRRLALRLLAYLPDNRWISIEQIRPLVQVFWRQTGGHVTTYNNERSSFWFLAWDDKELDADRPADWRRGPWAFFTAILQGPLRWLGLADLVLAGEEVQAFRLHGLADLFWDRVEALDFADLSAPAGGGSRPAVEEDSSPALSVDKAGRIRVDTAVIATAGHHLLRRMAQVVSSTVGEFVYKLDLNIVYATFESGLTPEDLAALWKTNLPVPMPRSVRSQLAQWWKAYGQVRTYRNATLIEFGDDFALTEMKAVTSLEKAIVAELSPRLVLIDGGAVTDLVAQLEKAGYTPKVN